MYYIAVSLFAFLLPLQPVFAQLHEKKTEGAAADICEAGLESWSSLEAAYDFGIQAIVWAGVPFTAEVSLELLSALIKSMPDEYAPVRGYLKSLLKTHENNVRKSTSEHVADQLRSLIEYYVFTNLDSNHKFTEALEADFGARSLEMFGKLGKSAQKARKTTARMKAFFDPIFSTAFDSVERADPDHAALLVAYAAKLLVSLHPEFNGDESSIRNSAILRFSDLVDWYQLPEFRNEVMDSLRTLDASYSVVPASRQRYCHVLNHWDIAPFDDACDSHSERKQASSASAKKGSGDSYLRLAVSLGGALLPPILVSLSLDSKQAKKNAWEILSHRHDSWTNSASLGGNIGSAAITKTVAKIVGAATTKPDILSATSYSRRLLQGLAVKSEEAGGDEDADYADSVNKAIQKRSAILLSQLAGFTRSNLQRILGVLIPKFTDTDQYLSRQKYPMAAKEMAAAAIYIRRNGVELAFDDGFSGEAAQVFVGSLETMPDGFGERVLEEIYELDAFCDTNPAVKEHYVNLLSSWGIMQPPVDMT